MVWTGSDQGVEPSSSSVPRYKCDLTLSGDHSRPIYDVAWNRLSNCIATAAGDDSICLYKPENLSSNPTAYSLLTKCEHAHSRDVNSLAWNPVYDNVLLSASDDETVKLWNVSYDQFGTLIWVFLLKAKTMIFSDVFISFQSCKKPALRHFCFPAVLPTSSELFV